MFYLCEAALAVVAIKSNVQNQQRTENEGIQYDCQIWEVILYPINIHIPLVNNWVIVAI